MNKSGVPMLADYMPAHAGALTHNDKQHYTQQELSRLIVQLDKLGATVKVHTAGDRSVRVTLNAIEAARQANGDSGLRHELAHSGYIDEADIIVLEHNLFEIPVSRISDTQVSLTLFGGRIVHGMPVPVR